MEKESFARFLDASWQAFRDQVLDAYEAGKAGLDLERKVAELELQLSDVKRRTSSNYTQAPKSERSNRSHRGSNASSFSMRGSNKTEGGPTDTLSSASPPMSPRKPGDQEVSDDSERSPPSLDLATLAMRSGDEDSFDAMSSPQSPQFTAPFLGAGLKGLSAEESRNVRHRLRVRLGLISSQVLVSGKALHDAVCSLGLTRYSLDDYNEMVNLISEFIGVQFEETEDKRGSRYSAEASRDRSVFSIHAESQDLVARYGMPIWAWPKVRLRESGMIHRAASMDTFIEKSASRSDNVVPAAALQELFFAQEWEVHRQIFGNGRLLKQFQGMKEILLAGDTNRLVAELTFVRINDLAAPPEPMHPLVYIEPFVALLIIANGIMIGFQTEDALEDWHGWVYFETTFASFLILEILLRLHLLRCKRFFCGPEKLWNYFDMMLGMTGIVDVIVQIIRQDNSDIFGTSLLRFCRLIRLVRIVKVFRLKFMRDLRLMVKGLVAGIRTLTLAFTLLFCVIYVISGFATMTLGTYESTTELGLDDYFRSLPVTMFTAFRCFTGECVNNEGHSLTSMLSQQHGPVFILAYVASYMLVAMGIFNVILAVYVEITMKAAKENEAVTAEQWARESIRIARVTRELLKRFAAAYRLFHEFDDLNSGVSRLDISPEGALFTDEDVHEGIAINKDLFLLVIQDRQVQLLMDDLDLPPDRANLFEIIDADGSGTLQIAELVQGLLKIRGEINKSDTVAALLVSQSVQSLVVEMRDEVGKNLAELKEASNRHLLTLWTQLDRMCQGKALDHPPLQRPSYGFGDLDGPGNLDGPADATHQALRPRLMLQEETG
eukprot:symbB.v1.2.002531.t1/scaffold127.1/size312441/3